MIGIEGSDRVRVCDEGEMARFVLIAQHCLTHTARAVVIQLTHFQGDYSLTIKWFPKLHFLYEIYTSIQASHADLSLQLTPKAASAL